MRKHIGLPRILLASLCLFFPLTSCVPVVGGALVVTTEPPPARVEVIGVAPGPGYIWIEGHWAWQSSDFVWVTGRWERRPHDGARWNAGRWRKHSNGWVWIEGSWS